MTRRRVAAVAAAARAAAAVALCAACAVRGRAQDPPGTPFTLAPADRVLVVAPHPDDEALSCGGVLQACVRQNLPVRIVFLTCGDNNQWSFTVYRKHPVVVRDSVVGMGRVRHAEAMAAAKTLGVSTNDLVFLGYPDFGTLAIWNTHWGRGRPPLRGMLTRAEAVPYEFALRPGAPHKGEEILRDILAVLAEFRPTKVFVSHASDHNPDHRAAYLFVTVALWSSPTPGEPPALLPYLTHFGRWPEPRGLHPREALRPPPSMSDVRWRRFDLDADEVEAKLNAIRAHASQYGYSRRYLESFVRTNEIYGGLPELRGPAGGAAEGPGTELAESGLDARPSAELSEQEREAFLGFESRRIRLTSTNVTVETSLSRAFGKLNEVSVFLFGFRPDRRFEDMPKIHVRLGLLGHHVYDQDLAMPADTVCVERSARRIAVSVPLRVLGRPEAVLASERTYMGEVPMDWTSWRVLRCSPAAQREPR